MSFINPSDVDLNNLILPTALKTTGMPGFKFCHRSNVYDYVTHSIDRFYIPSHDDCRTLKYPFPQPTDLAIALSSAKVDNNGCIPILLRDKGDDVYNQSVSSTGFIDSRVVCSDNLGIPILMNWDIGQAQKIMYENINDSSIRTNNYVQDQKYKYILFGKFPQSYVGDKLNNELLKKYVNGLLEKPLFDDKGNPIVYEIPRHKTVYCKDNGQEYLLVSDITFRKNVKLKTSNGSTMKLKQHMFFKIEPIMWQILNIDQLPLNLGGNSLHTKTNEVKLISKNVLLTGLDAYMRGWSDESNNGKKLDNAIRRYLHNDFPITAFDRHLAPITYGQVENALNKIGAKMKNCNLSVPSTEEVKAQIEAERKEPVSTLKDIKKPNAPLDENGQLKSSLVEKMENIENKLLKSEESSQGEKSKKMSEKKEQIIVNENNLSIQDQINFYVKNGISFMLHGLSGIGKSSRVQSINPDRFIGISLSDGMLPEEIKGKTLYPVGSKSYWEPPHWYTRITELCEQYPDQMNVLFIDELTNVDPHVQDLVFDLIQYKSIAPNQGKLPKNCVVVAAGNDKEDSASAYSLAEPLFRKFSAHIYIPLSVEEFLKYGTKPSKDDPTRPQIHPLVTSFISTNGKKVLHSHYDRDNPPKYAIDPRGWEQVSNIIYACNGKVYKSLIENKLGDNLTAAFVEFAKTPLLTLNDIIEGNYNEKDIPTGTHKQLNLALSLRFASKEQLPNVCSFISKNMHKEVLHTFLVEWAGKDQEKILFVDNMIKQGLHKSQLQPQKKTTKHEQSPTDKLAPSSDKVDKIDEKTTPVSDTIKLDPPTEDEVFSKPENTQEMFSYKVADETAAEIKRKKNIEKNMERLQRERETNPPTFITQEGTGAYIPDQDTFITWQERLKENSDQTTPKGGSSAFSRWWKDKDEDVSTETQDAPTQKNKETQDDSSEDGSYWIKKSMDNSRGI